MIRNVHFMTLLNAESSGMKTMNLYSLPQRQSSMAEKLGCIYGGIKLNYS